MPKRSEKYLVTFCALKIEHVNGLCFLKRRYTGGEAIWFFNVRHAKDTVHKAFLLVLKIEIFIIIYHHHHHLFRS